MQLTVESIRSSGFTGGPVKREVVWTVDGEEVKADVWIRRMSYHTAKTDFLSLAGVGDGVAQRIAACVCHEDGSPVFQVSDITGVNENGEPIMTKDENGEMVERGALNSSLSSALMLLISEVSGLGKTKPKQSTRRKKTSGTS